MLELLLVLTGLFDQEMNKATQATGFEFLLWQHEDGSVNLYAYQSNATTIGRDGLPNQVKVIADFRNVSALYGSNGVIDSLEKLKTSKISSQSLQ